MALALAVLFLLAGMFFAELAVLGLHGAGVLGALLLCAAALVLVRNRDVIEPR